MTFYTKKNLVISPLNPKYQVNTSTIPKPKVFTHKISTACSNNLYVYHTNNSRNKKLIKMKLNKPIKFFTTEETFNSFKKACEVSEKTMSEVLRGSIHKFLYEFNEKTIKYVYYDKDNNPLTEPPSPIISLSDKLNKDRKTLYDKLNQISENFENNHD